MSAIPPDAIPAVGRKRLWLNPKRWRFWIVTMPLAFWIILMILIWWPGLAFSLKISDTVYFERDQMPEKFFADDADSDWAYLRIGPVAFGKYTYPAGLFPLVGRKKGFHTFSDAGNHCVFYQWDSGDVSIGFSDNHNPPNLLFRF